MKTIPEYVEELVVKSPVLIEALSQNILNTSAYARIICPIIEDRAMRDISEASIIMALKRLQKKLTGKNSSIKDAIEEIIVRSYLFEFTLKKTSNSEKSVQKMMHFMHNHPNELFIVTNGIFETTVISSEKFKKALYSFQIPAEVISVKDTLSALVIRLKEKEIPKPGLYYRILQPLALHGVSVVEIASTYSELTIVVSDSQIEEAFSLLKHTFKKNGS